MKLTRLIVGAAVILVALWVLIGEQLAGASADAVVNARLATVRSPLAGTVALGPRSPGSRVVTGEELGSVADPLVDRVRLEDLAMERAFAQAGVARADALARATEEAIAPLDARTATYRAERGAELEARLGHARSRLAALGGPGAPAAATTGAQDDLVVVPSALVEEGSASEAGPGGALEGGATGTRTALALTEARERVDTLEIELRAAAEGVLLGDGYNDAPWSEQRAEELRGLLRERRAALQDATARLEAIDARASSARIAASRLASASLRSPVNGQLWEIRAEDGEVTQRGDAVMILLDCNSVLVTLSVTESVYNGLAPGDEARFRLSGDGRDFPATVARLGGAGAQTLYRNLAVAPSQQHLERFDVALLVPGLASAEGLDCPVGRTGRAFFERRPLDWLRGL